MISVAYTGYYPAEPERPVIVTVIGILGIVAGGLVLLSLPFSLMQLFGAFPMVGPGGQVMQDPTVRNWMIVGAAVSAVLGILKVVAGIGLLGMRRWAWLLAIGVLVFGALWQIAGGVAMQALDIMGRMWSSMGAAGDQFAGMMQRVTTIATIAGMVFWLAAYAAVIVLLTLPQVRRAFANR